MFLKGLLPAGFFWCAHASSLRGLFILQLVPVLLSQHPGVLYASSVMHDKESACRGERLDAFR